MSMWDDTNDDEPEVAEMRRLLGVLPISERPDNDVEIDEDALLARILARVGAMTEIPGAAPSSPWKAQPQTG
jgi:hypothetical protein